MTRTTRRLLAGYLAVALSFMVGAIFLWTASEQDSLARDLLAPTLLAAGTTAITAFLSLALILFRESREQQALQDLEAARAVRRPSFVLGGLSIPDVRVIAAGRLVEQQFKVTLTRADQPRPDPEQWPTLEGTVVPQLVAEAASRHVVLFDDEKLDLLRSTRTRRVEDGQPVTYYDLEVAPTTYMRFAAMSNRLDADISHLDLGADTLRELWDEWPYLPEHASQVPAPVTLGCVVVAVTRDEQVVLLERANVYVASGVEGDPRAAVHGVAEGMIPGDLRFALSPLRASALRALDEELGIDVEEAGVEPLAGLRCTGAFFDTQRWQVVFTWLAELTSSLDEVSTAQAVARDGWETAQVHGLPFHIERSATRALLLGQHERLVAASNHASVALALALIDKHGAAQVRSTMSWGASRGRRTQGPHVAPAPPGRR